MEPFAPDGVDVTMGAFAPGFAPWGVVVAAGPLAVRWILANHPGRQWSTEMALRDRNGVGGIEAQSRGECRSNGGGAGHPGHLGRLGEGPQVGGVADRPTCRRRRGGPGDDRPG